MFSGVPLRIAVVLGFAAGLPGGLGLYTFWYARGMSYMTDNPAACANCHVMQSYFDAWQASSHHQAAVCNDCHTPESFIPKYFTKATNGYHHSMAFTTGNFTEPIGIRRSNHEITEQACRQCHQDIVQMIDRQGTQGEEPLSCVRCHHSVGHLR